MSLFYKAPPPLPITFSSVFTHFQIFSSLIWPSKRYGSIPNPFHPCHPPFSHQHPGTDECVASYWSRWVMDDGSEMSDGVQAKVPIRGQPKGGVSPTGANGRRLGETAAVAVARPRLLKPSHLRRSVFSFALHFLPIHIHTDPTGHTFLFLWELWISSVCVSYYFKRLQRVLWEWKKTRKREGLSLYVCGWEEGGVETASGG